MIPATFVSVLAAFYWSRATSEAAFVSSLAGAGAGVAWTFWALPSLSPTLTAVCARASAGRDNSLAGDIGGTLLHDPRAIQEPACTL